MPTEPTEPTEQEARELLARAAATIDVADHAPLTLTGLPEPAPRRWPLLVAVAASVVLVAGGGWVVAAQVGNGDKSNGPATPTATDTAGLEHERTFSAARMPSVLGYTQDEATDLLMGRGRGIEVRVRARHDGCNVEDMVVGADVPVGSVLKPGSTVTLTVVKPGMIVDCIGEPDWPDTWALARFARGLDGPPELADDVDLSVLRDDEVIGSDRRSAATLSEPDGWTVCGSDECHSVLGGFARMLSDPAVWSYAGTPSVVVEDNSQCPAVGRPSLGPSQYQVWVEVPVDGVFCPATSLVVTTDGDGRIAGVELRLPAEPEGSDLTEPELDANMQRLSAARQFVTWARGDGEPPAFATSVDLLYRNRMMSELSGTEATERDLWLGCSKADSLPCVPRTANPLWVIADYKGPVVQTPERAVMCVSHDPLPPPLDTAAATDLVRLDQPEARNCHDAWAVELWIDADGRIYAVNLAAAPR